MNQPRHPGCWGCIVQRWRCNCWNPCTIVTTIVSPQNPSSGTLNVSQCTTTLWLLMLFVSCFLFLVCFLCVSSRSLHISHIRLEEETCVELAHNLSHNKRLLHLSIKNGGVSTANAVKRMADSLKTNVSLHWLVLEGHGHIASTFKLHQKDMARKRKLKKELHAKLVQEEADKYGIEPPSAKAPALNLSPSKRKSEQKLDIYRKSPICGPLCELIDYNKARSCRSELAEPV